MKRKFLLIPVLLLFSCGEIAPTINLDACPVFECPVFECPVCMCVKTSSTCTTQNIENCVEECLSDNNCLFSFSPKSCFKKCSNTCLNGFDCKWATE